MSFTKSTVWEMFPRYDVQTHVYGFRRLINIYRFCIASNFYIYSVIHMKVSLVSQLFHKQTKNSYF